MELGHILLSIFLCLHTTTASNATATGETPKWIPQYGTIEQPIRLRPGIHARANSVHKRRGAYFRAKIDHHFASSSLLPTNGTETDKWKPIMKGSFVLPKRAHRDKRYSVGDFYADRNGNYLKALTNGMIPPDCSGLRCPIFQSASNWEKINPKKQWMTLLRSEIGDKRLGDLVLPGTHNSGAVSMNIRSLLVDRTVHNSMARVYAPEILVNWSICQPSGFIRQLSAGFRYLDLRIADLSQQNKSFVWWHGLAGSEIEHGLNQIKRFATENPEEIIILKFSRFHAPGNQRLRKNLLPMRPTRKDRLSQILFQKLGSRLVPKTGLSNNPTVNEVLSTGKNIIAIVDDMIIRRKHPEFWFNVIHSSYAAKSNTEDLFNDRSDKLKHFKSSFSNSMTEISGCVTPNRKTLLGHLAKVYKDNTFLLALITGAIGDGNNQLDATQMSFEGLFSDLLTMAKEGTNTKGMQARPAHLYTSGTSVHYRGVNDMLRYWLARPELFKVNVIYFDHFPSSCGVDIAIEANKGEVPKEIRITFQGNPKDGFLQWEGNTATGGQHGLQCTSGSSRYRITSGDYAYDSQWQFFPNEKEIILIDGQYPPDANIHLEVSSTGAPWKRLFQSSIQSLLLTKTDLYFRTSDLGSGKGLAYISKIYNHFGTNCTTIPQNTLAQVIW